MDQWTICITYFSVMRTNGLLLCTWTNVLSYYCLNVTPTNHGKCRIISFPTAVLFVMPLDESPAFLWIGRGIISAHLLERKKLMGDTESCHGLHELECQFRKRSDALQSLKAKHKEVQINQRNTDFLKHAGQRLSLKNLPHHHGIAHHTRPSAHVRNIRYP